MKYQKTIAISLLAISLFVGVFIIGFQNYRTAGVAALTAPNDQNSGTNLPPAEADVNSLNQISGQQAPTSQPPTAQGANNLTQKLAQKIAQAIADKNQNGPINANNIASLRAIKPDDLIQSGIADEVKNFDYSQFQPVINQKKIVVVPDSAGAVTKYSVSLGIILQDNLLISLPADKNNLSLSAFATIKNAADNAVTRLYDVPVPQQLVSYHIQELTLLGSLSKAAAAVSSASNDPLLALMAVQYLEKVGSQLTAVNQELQKKIAAH